MIVKDMLDRKGTDVLLADADATVTEAVAAMCGHGVGSAVVPGPDGLPLGIVTERDILRQFAAHGGALGNLKVSEIMTSPVRSASAGVTLQEVMKIMTEHRFRHLPIVEDGRLVGILSIGDVVKARLRETEEEAESLRQYITS